MSTNKVKYKHKYFIAQIKNNTSISIDKKNRKQLIEISDIKWMNYEETVTNIRNYSIEKINLVNSINFFISNLILNTKKNIDYYLLNL